jgi:hypothetical protein
MKQKIEKTKKIQKPIREFTPPTALIGCGTI